MAPRVSTSRLADILGLKPADIRARVYDKWGQWNILMWAMHQELGIYRYKWEYRTKDGFKLLISIKKLNDEVLAIYEP